MTPKQLFHELLGLGKQWRVVRCEYETQDGGGEQTAGGVVRLSPAYITGVKENLGDQAVIVFDKFHVIMHANIAVDETRRVECRLANKPDRELLKESRWVLLKNPANHTDKQALKYAGLLKTNLASVKAHQMRLVLQEIYTVQIAALARRKLRAWCRWVGWVAGKHLLPLFSPFVKTAAMIERHLPGILAHWTHRTTNAFMEGLNSVFSAVKRKARGFRSVDNLIAMLYFTAGRLNLPATHWNCRRCDHETNNHNSESLFDRIKRFAVEGLGHGRLPRGSTGKHDRAANRPAATKVNPIE